MKALLLSEVTAMEHFTWSGLQACKTTNSSPKPQHRNLHDTANWQVKQTAVKLDKLQCCLHVLIMQDGSIISTCLEADHLLLVTALHGC